MYEIDLKKFGSFVNIRRKELGMTQKELAEKLFLSDKAVSKWERGISLPDVSVLVPLADALDVTVTELLEGEAMKKDDTLSTEQVEQVVQKAIGLSDTAAQEHGKRFQKEKLPIWLGMTAAAVAEFLLLLRSGFSCEELFSGLFTLNLLGILFGAYFWLFSRKRLPAYYDENKITIYYDGAFRMNMPGVYFNNRNWGHILHACRIWSLLASVAGAPAFFILYRIFGITLLAADMVCLFLFLAGLFAPIYYMAWKYS